MTVLSTTSNCASGKGSDCACAISNATSIPARVALRLALATISGDASMPLTTADAPTRRLAAMASVPVPHPMSSTDSPGWR